MEPAGPDRYVLRGGDQGAERLKLLTRVMWPTTRRLLRRAGLRPGMRCLDAGCGTGAVTLQMARRVGPAGQAVGTDRDERCVELARQEAKRRSAHAVFRMESVLGLREEGSYDLVFSRFLLSHLSQPVNNRTQPSILTHAPDYTLPARKKLPFRAADSISSESVLNLGALYLQFQLPNLNTLETVDSLTKLCYNISLRKLNLADQR